MAVKQIWAMPPQKFTSKKGNDILVGIKTHIDLGKQYKGSGRRERERAEKRLKGKINGKTAD